MEKYSSGNRAWCLSVALILVILSGGILSCATAGPGIPAPESPSSTLLVIPAETKIKETDKNFNLLMVGDNKDRLLKKLDYSIRLAGGEKSKMIRIDPRRGNTYVQDINAGEYTFTTIVQNWEAINDHRTQLETELGIPVRVEPGAITVFPYKFVYVLADENSNGIGMITLKIRNLTQEEYQQLLDELGEFPAFAQWEKVFLAPADPATLIYPLVDKHGTPMASSRNISEEFPPLVGEMPAAAAKSKTKSAEAVAGKRLAVLPFQAKGVSEQDVSVVTDLLSSSLANTGSFQVFERNQIDAVLKEIEFSQSSISDAGSQIEVGKLLAADYVVVGSVASVGTKIIVDAKLVAVATGQTVVSASEIKASLDDIIMAVKPMALKLSVF